MGPVVTESLPAASGPGSVMLDIGGSMGAAVIHTPSSLDGLEIEIRPEPGAWEGQHVAVRPRRLGGARVVHAAVFPSLPAGDYRLRLRPLPSGGSPEVPVTVHGGRVSEVEWPDAAPRTGGPAVRSGGPPAAGRGAPPPAP